MIYKSFCEYYNRSEKLDKEVNEYLEKMRARKNNIETRFCEGLILITIITI